MPIDIMSPVQALERAALAYKGAKESGKHLAIAQQNADSKRISANAYAQHVNNELSAEQKIQKSNNDVIISNNDLAKSKQTTKQTKEKTKQEQEFTNQIKQINRGKTIDMKSKQYNPNNPDMRNYQQQYLAITQDGIRNNQGNGSE